MGYVSALDTIIKLTRRRTLSLPGWAARRVGASRGAFVRVRETKEGVLIRPAKPANKAQAYFWTQRWQRMEAEVDAAVQRGKVRRSKNLKELLSDLSA